MGDGGELWRSTKKTIPKRSGGHTHTNPTIMILPLGSSVDSPIVTESRFPRLDRYIMLVLFPTQGSSTPVCTTGRALATVMPESSRNSTRASACKIIGLRRSIGRQACGLGERHQWRRKVRHRNYPMIRRHPYYSNVGRGGSIGMLRLAGLVSRRTSAQAARRGLTL